MRIPRVRIRTLMIVVLVVGFLSGSVARWRAREVRRQQLLAEMRVQQEVADSVIHEMLAELNYPGRKGHSSITGGFVGQFWWSSEVEAFESQGGEKTRLLDVEVLGGCDDDALRPIVMKTSGASLEAELVDRLSHVFGTHEWQFAVTESLPDRGK